MVDEVNSESHSCISIFSGSGARRLSEAFTDETIQACFSVAFHRHVLASRLVTVVYNTMKYLPLGLNGIGWSSEMQTLQYDGDCGRCSASSCILFPSGNSIEREPEYSSIPTIFSIPHVCFRLL